MFAGRGAELAHAKPDTEEIAINTNKATINDLFKLHASYEIHTPAGLNYTVMILLIQSLKASKRLLNAEMPF